MPMEARKVRRRRKSNVESDKPEETGGSRGLVEKGPINRGAEEEEEHHSYSSKCYDSRNNMSHQMGQNTSQQLAINQSVKATSSILPTVLDNRKHDTTNLSMMQSQMKSNISTQSSLSASKMHQRSMSGGGDTSENQCELACLNPATQLLPTHHSVRNKPSSGRSLASLKA
jgi:hypothetical protein